MAKKEKMTELKYNLMTTNLDLLYKSALAAEKRELLPEFKVRYQKLEEYYDSFTTLSLDLQAADYCVGETAFEDYTQKYVKIKVIYDSLFGSEPASKPNKKRVALPNVVLPTFRGRVEDYPSFIDLFTALIIDENFLSNTEKLYYLLGSLDGEPRSLLQHLTVTGSNLSVALELLESRYGNKRILADKLLCNLLATSHVTRTFQSMRSFLNTLLENTKALEKLGLPVEQWSYLLLYINLQKLEINIRKRFEDTLIRGSELPIFTDLIQFLENECLILETSQPSFITEKLASPKVVNNRRTAHAASIKNTCLYCKRDNHIIVRCFKFKALNPRARKRYVQDSGLCYKCLGSHSIDGCKATDVCKSCSTSKHHSLLHFDDVNMTNDYKPNFDKTKPNMKPIALLDSNDVEPLTSDSIKTYHSLFSNTVLLPTVTAFAKDAYGGFHLVRILLDQGSQCSFISKDCAKRLNLKLIKSDHTYITGLGGNVVGNKCEKVNITLFPRHEPHNINITICGIVLPKLTENLPNQSLVKANINTLGLLLADEQFNVSRKVDILIGSDFLSDVFTNDVVKKLGPGLPSASNTIFGYTLWGPVADGAPTASNNFVGQLLEERSSLDNILFNFFEIEGIPEKRIANPQDLECELHFKATHCRNELGKYVVRLPFVKDKPELGHSKHIALRRFFTLEKKFERYPIFKTQYVKFMQEYIDLGHMSLSQQTLSDLNVNDYYIIPHHGIFKSGGDKIRVVFDGSCATDSGYSINDCLHAGPKLQRDIMDIICKFRTYKFVFTADIKMMFRQFIIHESDRQFQLILWRESPDLPVQLFTLNTNTYGLKSSPYLAIRCLLQLAQDEEHKYPRAAKLLNSSVYMDDILGGAESLDQALSLKQELIQLLSCGSLELRKWSANYAELLSDLSPEFCESLNFDSPEQQNLLKILGVQWNPKIDKFSYKVNLFETNKCTKRIILSTIAKTFDPLGWIAPVIFKAKVILQRLWLLNLSWDDVPPPEIINEWLYFIADLPHIESIKIERWILSDNVTSVSIHGFCDASELGYAAVVYARCVDPREKVAHVSLLMSKSRVAPIKSKLTIPKLELNAAALLVKVIDYVATSFQGDVPIDSFHCWSDSAIVLAWLQTPVHTLDTFVGNRVSNIVNCNLSLHWRHVPSRLNPADVSSRGCLGSDLIKNLLWWKPGWLCEFSEFWPASPKSLPLQNLPGLRKARACFHIGVLEHSEICLNIINKFSSFTKIVSIVGYCLRFINNAKGSTIVKFKQNYLTVAERQVALDHLIRSVQAVEFSSDLNNLNNGKKCSQRLQRLLPFIDTNNILRVGGRLKNSGLPYAAKHPILLPKSNLLTHLIIDYFHIVHSHAGPSALQAILQNRFWILSARQIIRSRIFRCMSCFRLRAKPVEPLMADLPSDRVNPTHAFRSVYTDFAGPFSTKSSALRNCKIIKSYLCVFVCATSKAVHLEVVSSLSTEAFLNAFTRFVSRRGLPVNIRSDCGTNYIGAGRYLREVQYFLKEKTNQDIIVDEASRKGVSWSFNPPGAPHFGGLFEAAVKSAKSLLHRVIGEQVLTFEGICTLMSRIEAVLNSRPLCPLSSDITDIEVLTPAHLLIGRSLVGVPEADWDQIPTTNFSNFKLLQQLAQQFWHKWHQQYLHTLQMRSKWTSKTDPPKIGDLVLIKEEGILPLKWKRGRILELHPGSDGIVRVVTLRCQSGTVKRPVVKICRLPTQ